MPVIDSGPIQEIIKALKNNAAIVAFVAKDVNSVAAVRPEQFQPISTMFPSITVSYEEGKSEISIPASGDTVRITTWLSGEESQAYSQLDDISKIILALFNRTGQQLNNLDVATDSGVRFCLFIKMSASNGFEPNGRKFYNEIIFKVIRSENESFDPTKSSVQPWV